MNARSAGLSLEQSVHTIFHRVYGTTQGNEVASPVFQRVMHEVHTRWTTLKCFESSREASNIIYTD